MYDSDNIFAKILRGEIPNETVYEDEHVLAFHDVNPHAKVHVLVIPKGEYVSLQDFAQKAGAEAVEAFFKNVTTVAEQLGVAETGYRLLTNHGQHGNQTVPHFHVHILGGEQLGGF